MVAAAAARARWVEPGPAAGEDPGSAARLAPPARRGRCLAPLVAYLAEAPEDPARLAEHPEHQERRRRRAGSDQLRESRESPDGCRGERSARDCGPRCCRCPAP